MPPVALTASKYPWDSTANAFAGVSVTEVVAAEDRMGTVATATTPFAIAVVFDPLATQVTLPDAASQLRLLLAAVSAEPAAKVTGPITPDG